MEPPAFGDLAQPPATSDLPARRTVDVGRGTAWIMTFANGRLIQLRVQLAPEQSIDVYSQDMTAAQVTAFVRAALQR